MHKIVLVLLLALLTTTVILCDTPAAETQTKTEATSTALAPVEGAQTLEADTLRHHHHHHRHHHHVKRHHHHRHHKRHHHVRRHHHHAKRHHHHRHHVRKFHPRRVHHVRHHVKPIRRVHHHKRHHHVKRHVKPIRRVHHHKRHHHVRRHHHHIKRHHHVKPARKVFRVHHHKRHHRKVNRRHHKKLVRRVRKLSHRVRKMQVKHSRKFRIVRKQITLPKLQKIQLHNTTPVYTDNVANVPKNARALIIGVYYLHGNHPNGHGYLNFEMSQKGTDQNTGVAKMTNYHYNWYFNSDYYEFMLPWSGKLSQEIITKVTSSYNTGSYPNNGNQNYYKINVEGYLLH